MRRSAASGTGAFRRSSRIALRSGFELLALAALLAGCASGTSGVTAAQSVPFTDHGATQQSGNDDGARLTVATAPNPSGLGGLAPTGSGGRLYIGVFAGAQRTGGYGVQVDRVERTADTLFIHATFIAPGSSAITTQVLTSPAQLVSIDGHSASGLRTAVLIDQSGAERARATVPPSG